MKRKHNLFLVYIFLLLSSLVVQAQNELYVKGDSVLTVSTPELYINGWDSINPTLFVRGSVVNVNGEVVNDSSVLELTGDFVNRANSITAGYQSTGEERFSGDENSAIKGNFSDTLANINQFHNLVVDKDSSYNCITLYADVFVSRIGALRFEQNGIITTDSTYHGSDGEAYNFLLYLRNTAPLALTGHSVGNGAKTKYVEGKLKREIGEVASYYFPIGLDTGSIGGMSAFQLEVNSLTDFKSGILGYVKEESSNTLASTITTYADLGTHPGGLATGLDFSNDPGNCSSGDGVLDRVVLSVGQSHSWVVTPDSINGLINYNVEFFPSSELVASQSFYTCGSLNLQYLTKNDIPGGDVTTTGQALPSFSDLGYLTSPNSSNSLDNQTSFSTFRNTGAVISGTTLPVELISLTANSVDNSYILVDWLTATEVNNQGFELQRSINGIDFETIAWIDGAGNTSNITSYSYKDKEVLKGIVYYYRLNQKDFDGASELSKIVSASLRNSTLFEVAVYPNPSKLNEELMVSINSTLNVEAKLNVYDVLGKLIISEQLSLLEGLNTYKIDNSLLASGQYFIRVNLPETQLTKNLVVID